MYSVLPLPFAYSKPSSFLICFAALVACLSVIGKSFAKVLKGMFPAGFLKIFLTAFLKFFSTFLFGYLTGNSIFLIFPSGCLTSFVGICMLPFTFTPLPA